MKVSNFTRNALVIRREHRDMPKAGWEFVGEGGGKLWEISRGWRMGCKITDVRIAACGRALWVKVDNGHEKYTTRQIPTSL